MQNRILGIDYQNGIYRGKDGYLIQGFEKSEIDKEDQEKQKILNSFLERNSQLQSYVMLVPTASWILKDLLPSGAPQGDEKSWYESWLSTSKISELSNVTVVDCADELTEAAKTNQIYYRTDHHWTTYGASAAFKELAKQMDIPYEKIRKSVELLEMTQSDFSFIVDENDYLIYAPDSADIGKRGK